MYNQEEQLISKGLYLTIKLRRLLNTGIAKAIIQAMIQRPTPMPIQDPMAIKSRFCIRSVPANTRV